MIRAIRPHLATPIYRDRLALITGSYLAYRFIDLILSAFFLLAKLIILGFSLMWREAFKVDQTIILNELTKFIKSFAKYKSPGPDGWPVEFYLEFLDLIGPKIA